MPNDAQTVTVVTGGSRGIGRCLVQSFLRRGHVVNLSRSAATVDGAPSNQLHNLAVDLSEPVQAVAALSDWLTAHPDLQIDRFISNAAFLGMGWTDALAAPLMARTFAINTSSPVALTGAVLARRRFAARARIVYVVSSLGRPLSSLSFAGLGMYSASKAALARLAQIQARELQLRGSAITVVRAHPGIVATDMQDQLRGETSLDPAFAEKTAGLPAYEAGAWSTVAPSDDPRTISAQFSADFIEWVADRIEPDSGAEYDFYATTAFHDERRRQGATTDGY